MEKEGAMSKCIALVYWARILCPLRISERTVLYHFSWVKHERCVSNTKTKHLRSFFPGGAPFWLDEFEHPFFRIGRCLILKGNKIIMCKENVLRYNIIYMLNFTVYACISKCFVLKAKKILSKDYSSDMNFSSAERAYKKKIQPAAILSSDDF